MALQPCVFRYVSPARPDIGGRLPCAELFGLSVALEAVYLGAFLPLERRTMTR
jgi:hypothetical protein